MRTQPLACSRLGCEHFFYENGIAFNAARSRSYFKMMRAVRGAAQGRTSPAGFNALRTKLLDALRTRGERNVHQHA
eukprot:191963-Chlamydomonas_euryale.AAC.1